MTQNSIFISNCETFAGYKVKGTSAAALCLLLGTFEKK